MPDNAKPLILLTRPQEAADRFTATLRHQLGAKAVISVQPLMRLDPILPLPDLVAGQGVIFTSEVAARLVRAPQSAPAMTAWCVGDRTAEAANASGFQSVSANGTAEDLIALLTRAAPTTQLVHLHGEHTRGAVAARLRAAGLSVMAQPIYRQTAADVPPGFAADLRHPAPILAPLFSPRSARLFVAATGPQRPEQVIPVALSEAVQNALPADWQPYCWRAAHPSGPAMEEILRHAVCGDASVDGCGRLV